MCVNLIIKRSFVQNFRYLFKRDLFNEHLWFPGAVFCARRGERKGNRERKEEEGKTRQDEGVKSWDKRAGWSRSLSTEMHPRLQL